MPRWGKTSDALATASDPSCLHEDRASGRSKAKMIGNNQRPTRAPCTPKQPNVPAGSCPNGNQTGRRPTLDPSRERGVGAGCHAHIAGSLLSGRAGR